MNSISRPAFIALALSLGCIQAQESGSPKDDSASPEEKEWLEFYYENPKPEKLVSEVREWSKDGTLVNEAARPAVIAFLSQVFRQNREKIAGWYDQLSLLPAEDKQIIHTALLYSRTTEADALLRDNFGKKYDEEKQSIPKILEMSLAQANTFDMLWGYFYATGSKSAIRRIIWSYRFDEAPDNPDFAKIPEDYQPLYKTLPEAADWSLISNAERHPKVREFCEELYEKDEDLVAPEKRRLRELLSELDPEKYPKEPPKSDAAETDSKP